MALFEGKTPAERNKLIGAIGLGVAALLVITYNFGLFSSSKKRTRRPSAKANSNRSLQPVSSPLDTEAPLPEQVRQDPLIPPQPVDYQWAPPDIPEAGRNIFAYYTAPPPPSAAVVTAATPQVAPVPSPTPPPPLILAMLAPASVYARTSNFTLQVSGDKFTPLSRVYINEQELPTSFISPQQLSATVPAALIGSEGTRQVVVRTPDGKLYSNTLTLNVAPPPAPPYSYVGLIGGKRYNDTAVLKDRSGQLLNVQRGDLLAGRFRVTSISERAVEFIDTDLRIKHSLPFAESGSNTGNGNVSGSIRPWGAPSQPPVIADDDTP